MSENTEKPFELNKRIFIVGNTIKILGVEADLKNYFTFFTSSVGGEWLPDEVNIQTNLTTAAFKKWVDHYRELNLDYFIFVFCGHGGTSSDGETLEMQLSISSQTALETDIANIANRQLNIFDCCRDKDDAEDLMPISESRRFSVVGSPIGNVRSRYDYRIAQAVPQCSSLYACSIGETAQGSSKGGFYTQYLLQSARKIDNRIEKTIGRCHTEAEERMKLFKRPQTPDYALPRCLACKSLILSIHP